MTTQQLYQKTLTEQMSRSEFLYAVRKDSQYSNILSNSMSFEDTVSALKNKGYISDPVNEDSFIKSYDFLGAFKKLTEGAKKQKLKGGKGDKLTPDQVNYYEFRKGWKCELEHTDDIDKAKEIALDHLAEDPMYYTRLEMIETKAKKKERSDLPVDVSKNKASMKDAANQMSAVDKKKQKPNVSDSGKKEKARSKSAGIKKMKGGSGEMKSLKENSSYEEPVSEQKLEDIKQKIEKIRRFRTEKSANAYDVKFIGRPQKFIIYMSPKEAEKRIKNPDQYNIESISKNTTEQINLNSSTKFDIKPITGGGKVSSVYLAPEEAEKRIANPENYNIEYMIKSGTLSSVPEKSVYKYDEYPAYVYDKVDKKLIGQERLAFAREYEVSNPDRYEALSNTQAKAKKELSDGEIVYEEEPVKKNVDFSKVGDSKKYYVINRDTNEIISSHEDGKEASREALKLNNQQKTDKYTQILAKYLKQKIETDKKNIKEEVDNEIIKKGEQVSFVVQGTENSDSKDIITNTISDITTKDKNITIKMSDNSRLEVSDSAGEPEAMYYSKGGEEGQKVEALSSKNIRDFVDSVYKTTEDKKKEKILEDYIRKKVRSFLEEYDAGPYIGSSGPDVVKKKLIDYLEKQSPDWETDPSPKQRAIGSEYEDIIAMLVAELDGKADGLGTKIYKKYSSKPLGKNAANRSVPAPATLAYDPTKLVSRGGRIAE